MIEKRFRIAALPELHLIFTIGLDAWFAISSHGGLASFRIFFPYAGVGLD